MKKRKPDNLDLDVRRAELLGYGPHYGRYKADYPKTKPDIVPDDLNTQACPVCGTRFRPRKKQKYCCERCRQAAYLAKQK